YLDERAQYAEAEPLCKRALDIREKALGPEHPDTANSLNNLAALYYSQGRYAEAEPLYRRALGPEHPHTVKVLENYAALLREMGREDEVDELEARGALRRGPDSGPDGGFDRCAARERTLREREVNFRRS